MTPARHLRLDAAYVEVRDVARVVSMAVRVAIGAAVSGGRRILVIKLTAGKDEGSVWPAFIQGLVERGLAGVRLVIGAGHRGLLVAIREQLFGASRQRSWVQGGPGSLVPSRTARSMVRRRSGRSSSRPRSPRPEPGFAASPAHAAANLDRAIAAP